MAEINFRHLWKKNTRKHCAESGVSITSKCTLFKWYWTKRYENVERKTAGPYRIRRDHSVRKGSVCGIKRDKDEIIIIKPTIPRALLCAAYRFNLIFAPTAVVALYIISYSIHTVSWRYVNIFIVHSGLVGMWSNSKGSFFCCGVKRQTLAYGS